MTQVSHDMICVITDYDWVHVADLPDRLLWPSQRRIFSEIVQEIINGGPARPYLQIPV